MKRIFKNLSMAPLAALFVLSGCGTQSQAQNQQSKYVKFFNKTYVDDYGYACKFYDGFVAFQSDLLTPCFYTTELPSGDYNNRDYPEIVIDMEKEYVTVYAQGRLRDYPNYYFILGLFYDDKTFVSLPATSYGQTITNVFTLDDGSPRK